MTGGPGWGAQQAGYEQGGMTAGSSALGFMANTVPAMASSALMFGGMVGGPLLEHGLAGRAGMMAGAGRMFGTALNYSDPLSMATLGWRGGSGLGTAMGMGRMGAGLMGGIGTLGVGMAAYGAMTGMSNFASSVWSGGMNVMQGQQLANQIGPGIAPGQNMAGQGAQFGSMLRSMSQGMNVSTDDLSRYAQDLNTQKVFQTVKSAKEFQSKFGEVMKAVKEIAKMTQTTVDDAVKMFGDLRQQGFYTTADIKAQAASTQAREAATGLSYGTLNAIGGAGAQTARSYGMRGRFGSNLAQRDVSAISMGVRSGAISEEEVMERGGAEAVGMNMAQKEMAFLSSPRGRAVIAASMGAGGAPDPTRLRKLLSGNMSTEDLVTTAAGRGLGTLMQAGTRESKEAMMPYAGMAMIQVAMGQSKQLYGGVSERSTIGMLGTMGMDRQTAKMFIQQQGQLGDVARAEVGAAASAQSRSLYEDESRRQSLFGREGRLSRTSAGREYYEAMDMGANFGAATVRDVSNTYKQAAQALYGGRTYESGGADDSRMAREFVKSRGKIDYGGGGSEASLLGARSTGEIIQEQYKDLVFKAGEGDKAYVDKMVKSGTFKDVGGGKYVDSSALNSRERAVAQGAKARGTNRDEARISLAISGGQFGEKVENVINEARRAGMKGTGFLRADADVEASAITYVMGQERGMKTGSFADFMGGKGMTGNEKAFLEEMTNRTLKETDGENAEKLRKRGPASKRGDMEGAQNLQQARDQTRTAAEKLVETASGGKKGLFGFSSGQTELINKLSGDGTARAKYSDYVDAMKSGDPERIQAAKKSLNEALGGEKSGAGSAFKDMENNLTGEGVGKLNDALGRKGKQQSYMDAVTPGLKAEAERLAKLDTSKLSETGKSLLTQARGASEGGDVNKRNDLMKQLTKELAQGGLDSGEKEILSAFGSSGGTYTDNLDKLLSGKGLKTDDAKINERIKKLKKGDVEESMSILEDMGQDPDTAEDSGKTSQVEGAQAEYVAKNREFVQAVDKFVSNLKDAGVLKDKEEGNSVGDAVKGLLGVQ